MALFDCAECGNQVSDQAPGCPQCGAPVKGGVALKQARASYPDLPSGTWNGYYRYWWGWSRTMAAHLVFDGNRVSGQGSDAAGAFMIDGTIDAATRAVNFKKEYSRHRVFYTGRAEDGGISGTWKISLLMHGTFAVGPIRINGV